MPSMIKACWMNTISIRLIVLLIIIALISGCTASPTTPEATSSKPSTANLLPQKTPTLEQTPPPLSEGPLLLVQTGFETYHIIDISQQTAYAFDSPGDNMSFNLGGNLSPSGKRMFFPADDEVVLIMDFSTWEEQHLENLCHDSPVFNPQTTAEEGLDALPELGFTFEDMLSAVEAAFTQSIQNLQWLQDDTTLLSAQAGSPTSTNLYRYDLQTGERTQLEDRPGLVQALWVAPGGEKILVKKNYIFHPNAWQDDSYFVVDVADPSVEPIPLPQDSKYPSLSWLGPNHIGITHHTQPQSGTGYSIINVTTMESTLILDGAFTQIRADGENLVVTRQDQAAKTTLLEWLNFNGEVTHSQTIDQLCRITAVINRKTVLNCETESLWLDETTQPQSFGDPIFLLSPAPDGESIVLITRTEESFLLNAALVERQPLALAESPLEIRWLPDSSGFLYRTLGELLYYDLTGGLSHLLFTSDIFGDYTNINAVWINTE
jgi:hypothetical protein